MSEDTRKNAPPPMSLKEYKEYEKAEKDIERVQKMAIDLAHDFCAKYLSSPDSVLFETEIAYLSKNPLDTNRRELLVLLAKSCHGAPMSWRDFPDSYAVRSFFSEKLDRLVEEFGSEPVRQHILEYFSGQIAYQKDPKDLTPTAYSNKELATAFSPMIFIDKSLRT